MDLKQLRALCAVSEKHGFSAAAAALGLSQPTISFQVSSLEAELGARLFERAGRETTLTEAGRTLYGFARRILDEAEGARQAIDELQGLVRGKLQIGASNIPGEYLLPGLLPAFAQRFPGISIDVSIAGTGATVRKVLDNEVELGVVGAREEVPGLAYSPLCDDRIVLIAPGNGPAASQFQAPELKDLAWVQREPGSGTRAIIRQRLEELGIREEELNVRLTTGSTTAVKQAVQAGVGSAFISRRAVRNELQLGLVREVAVAGLEISRQFYIVERCQRVHSPAAAAFLEYLKQAVPRT